MTASTMRGGERERRERDREREIHTHTFLLRVISARFRTGLDAIKFLREREREREVY